MNIDVKLLHVTPLEIAVGAIRQCYESNDRSDSGRRTEDGLVSSNLPWMLGPKDKALIKQIIKFGHTSTLEHIFFNFHIDGISRLNLQELARHRHASLSVKSTRYTLKELKDEPSFILHGHRQGMMTGDAAERISKYINMIGVESIDRASILALENLRELVQSGLPNDQTKYALPECYRLKLYWSINARSLRNFFQLRRGGSAHFEIRELANKVYQATPESYRFLFED